MEDKRRVDVIAVCNADGFLQPLRIRLQMNQTDFCRFDISRILDVKEITAGGEDVIAYMCRAHQNGRERVFELRYHIQSHVWDICRSVY